MKEIKRKKVNYIGPLPPPYGGVTIRNSEFQKALKDGYDFIKFNTSDLKRSFFVYIKLILFIYKFRRNPGIISLSTPSFLKLTKILSKILPSVLKKYIVITAGGTVDRNFKNSSVSVNILNTYRRFFVETNRLKSELLNLGIKNVEFLPNCRLKPKSRFYRESDANDVVKFVSISRVSVVKGINTILETEKLLENFNNYQIDIYGPVEKEFEDYFFNSIKQSKNINYKGVFEGDKHEINDLLVNYDVMLFPTKYKGEGHPGVLTNAKIAGCAVIATNINANAEIIKDKVNGLIIEESDSGLLKESIEVLLSDYKLLKSLRKGSYDSANLFFVENYTDMLISAIES